ncbi:MAG TPA: hypothetical protein VGD88_03675 [Opitutaceae bacterium]
MTIPFPLHSVRAALLASLVVTLNTFAQTAGAPEQPVPEHLATEAAAQGKPDAERQTFEGMLSLALAERQTLAQVSDAGHWNRAQIAAAVEARYNLTRPVVGQAREKVGDMEPAVRERVATALTKVDTAETELQSAIRNARNAEETDWTGARERLSDAFEDYASAVMVVATAVDAALTQAPGKK